MDIHLPGILVTGASGFVGRNFLKAVMGKYRLFCIARQSQKEAGIPKGENVRWTQVDIANWETLREVKRCIKQNGGAEYVLHLAGYYDFTNSPNQEYERTNVSGTRNVLTLAKEWPPVNSLRREKPWMSRAHRMRIFLMLGANVSVKT
jgi:nucleoside-diphosphate-sugar epimerase